MTEPNTASHGNHNLKSQRGNPNWMNNMEHNPIPAPPNAAAWFVRFVNAPNANNPSRMPDENPAIVNALSITLLLNELAHTPIAICNPPKKTVSRRVVHTCRTSDGGTEQLGNHKSLTTDDAEAASELDRVDITAAKIAASINPISPVFLGNEWIMKCEKMASFLMPTGSVA